MVTTAAHSPQPTEITLHQQSRRLDIVFDDGQRFSLPCEYLRVYSPSADVRGHSATQQVLQVGKREVAIVAIEPVGHYAVRLIFDDGHSSGLYTWGYLYELGCQQIRYWQDYLSRLAVAHASRDGSGSEDGSLAH